MNMTVGLTYDPFTSPTNPPVSRRAFDPYGNELGSSGQSAAWIDDRAFLNQPKNPVANLVDTGVREYSATTGRFTSVDPQLDLSSALQANGYNYANNNPVRYSDPSGTAPACVREGTCTFKPNPLGGSPIVTGTREGASDNSGSSAPVSTPGVRAVDKILENIAVHDFYASGKDADEKFVQEMVVEDEKNRNSPEKLFNLRNGYACLNHMPSCLPRDDVIEVARGWANGSNEGAILALKQAAIYLAGGVAGKLASVAFLRLASMSFLSTSTADLLERIATQANAKIGTNYGGRGPVFGTKVHTEFASAINLLGRKDLATEVSYLRGNIVPYGTKGAVRLDVVEGNTMAPKAIYDLKTGTASLSTARIAQIRSQLPVGYQNIPISEVRP